MDFRYITIGKHMVYLYIITFLFGFLCGRTSSTTPKQDDPGHFPTAIVVEVPGPVPILSANVQPTVRI